jgi:hypothetical protein
MNWNLLKIRNKILCMDDEHKERKSISRPPGHLVGPLRCYCCGKLCKCVNCIFLAARGAIPIDINMNNYKDYITIDNFMPLTQDEENDILKDITEEHKKVLQRLNNIGEL